MPASRWSEYRYRRRVHFYELDSAGIVHFSTYFRYMEEAEHAFWRAAGLSIAPRGADVGFPRVAATCEYRAPLRFEEEFEVHLRVAAMGTTSMRYGCTIRSGETLVATGTLAIVSVQVRPDAPMRPVPLPPSVRERFEVAGAAPAGGDVAAAASGDVAAPASGVVARGLQPPPGRLRPVDDEQGGGDAES